MPPHPVVQDQPPAVRRGRASTSSHIAPVLYLHPASHCGHFTLPVQEFSRRRLREERNQEYEAALSADREREGQKIGSGGASAQAERQQMDLGRGMEGEVCRVTGCSGSEGRNLLRVRWQDREVSDGWAGAAGGARASKR